MWKRITKREALKRFYAGKPIWLQPCKLCPGGWAYPCQIDPPKHWEHAAIVKRVWRSGWTAEDATQEIKEAAWESMYNNWAYYNTSWEMGYYAHYYIKEAR